MRENARLSVVGRICESPILVKIDIWQSQTYGGVFFSLQLQPRDLGFICELELHQYTTTPPTPPATPSVCLY